jgi:hypothetical protein
MIHERSREITLSGLIFAANVKTGLLLKLSDFEDSPPWAKASRLLNRFAFTTREQ